MVERHQPLSPHDRMHDPLALPPIAMRKHERVGSAMATGISRLNHITLAVADIERSLAFYRDVLGLMIRAVWADGAYLEAGSLWLCLSREDDARSSPHSDYTHIAFSVCEADYGSLSERLAAQCVIWKDNGSEAASTYFLDPDGHKLEIHLGTFESRLSHCRAHPVKGRARDRCMNGESPIAARNPLIA